MAIDPVCGMDVDPEKAKGESLYNGEKVYFCALRCKERFDAEPEKYLVGRAAFEKLPPVNARQPFPQKHQEGIPPDHRHVLRLVRNEDREGAYRIIRHSRGLGQLRGREDQYLL